MFKKGDKVKRIHCQENWLWERSTGEHGEDPYGVFVVESASHTGAWVMFKGYSYRWQGDNFELVQSHLSSVTVEDFL